MSEIDDGGPAFAHSGTDGHEGYPGNLPQAGMSLRDWFAGQALAAIIAKIPTDAFKGDGTLYQRVGIAAYYYADGALAARKGGAA